MTPLTPQGESLVELGQMLLQQDYAFHTVTPCTHLRVLARDDKRRARNSRDVFGWCLPFERELLPSEWLKALTRADALASADGLCWSRVRFSTFEASPGQRSIYAHSAFPTNGADDVFFGPDTYRFLACLRRNAPSAERCVDVGCGTGAAGLFLVARARRVVLADINERALFFARVNSALAGVDSVEVVASDVLSRVGGGLDLVVSNPPYLVDRQERVYRHGGGDLGTALAVRIVEEGLGRLDPGGTLILYSGAPFVEGRDMLLEALRPMLDRLADDVEYEEIDVDVFGEELTQPAYESVERIAAVSLVCRRGSGAVIRP
jgi:SAM-dependent methyltransferase